VAAETSTLTIISVPGLAYDTNFKFLRLVMGHLVGRVIISFLLLPQYFRGDSSRLINLSSGASEGRLRSLTARLFLVTRAAAEGVRIFAVALVVGVALGPPLGNISELQRDVISIGIVTPAGAPTNAAA
jgi:SSS family solute:Na+ symporter